MSGSYGEYLKQLLRPLGVYRLENSFNGAELESIGARMDEVQTLLEEIHIQADLTTAGEEGLKKVESLFSREPVTEDLQRLRRALAALLRIGGDSFTLKAINDNLSGCGVKAVASEAEAAQTVEVRFPEVPGIPDGYEEMRKIIEDILPCHLAVKYVFWYVTWAELEERFATWGEVEAMNLTWEELEKLVM